MTEICLTILITFIASAILTPLLIPILRKHKAGQSIREVGPNWHMSKTGTPTMGGIAFILPALIVPLFFVRDLATLLVLGAALAFGLIGFADDYISVVHKRNLGFTARAKFLWQLVVAVVFVCALRFSGVVDDTICFPFIKAGINLGYFYIPLMVFLVLAAVNSVNITDGIDGLASSVSVVVALFFALGSILFQQTGIGILAGAVIGGVLGFLIYNAHPAKIFMGDTGSLFLGGLLVMISIVQKTPVYLILAGAMYFVETLSVMIQVTCYKLTGKRVFKMSPIHHHFEMCGLSEVKIVALFVSITVVLSILGYVLLSFSV